MKDWELTRLLQAHPEEGLEAAMLEYAPLVKGILCRILPQNPCDREECMADVFVALWRNAAKLEAACTPLRPWLAVAARNRGIDCYNALRRRETVTLDDGLAETLGSINFAAPAVAEQLPVVGSLFSWLNRGGQDDYVSLQSEQLNKYAETVESTAETADSPYTLTLGQVFNDGDWLRISLMLTSEDDSLAGFNAIGPREDAVEKALQNGGGQYGTLVLDNGTELSGGVTFGKRDDRTFVMGLNYELFLTHDDLAGHTATLTLSDLMACNKSIVETDGKSYWHYDYADQTPLPGTYTLTFTIPEVSDAGVRTMSTPVEQDGVTLQSIKATPAATKVLLTFPPEQHWVSVKLYTADGTELGHERGEGGWWTDGAWTADPADFDHPEQSTKASYDYFAAVPENCHSLTVKVYDFDTDAELTTFTAELP